MVPLVVYRCPRSSLLSFPRENHGWRVDPFPLGEGRMGASYRDVITLLLHHIAELS